MVVVEVLMMRELAVVEVAVLAVVERAERLVSWQWFKLMFRLKWTGWW